MDGLRVIDDWGELVDLVEERPDLMLRFSNGPDADRRDEHSRDYEAGVDLPGLSVTPIGPEPWWTRSTADWVARRLCQYADLGEEEERFPCC